MYFRKIRQLAEIPAEPGDMSDSKKAPRQSPAWDVLYCSSISITAEPSGSRAALPLHHVVGNNDFRCHQLRIFHMAYHLAAASIPSWQAFTSTDVRGGKVSLARRELLKDRMDTSPGHGQPQTNTYLLQGHCQYVVADQYGRGSVLPCEQGRQGLVLLLRHRRHFHAQLAVKRNTPLCQGQPYTPFSCRGYKEENGPRTGRQSLHGQI